MADSVTCDHCQGPAEFVSAAAPVIPPHYTLEEALQRVACELHSDAFAKRVRRVLGDGVELSIGVRLTHNHNGGFNVIFGLTEIRHRQDLLNARRCP